MTNSFRFIRFSRVRVIAFAVLVLSIGELNIARAEHAASPHESAAAVALNCFDAWVDRPADLFAAVECMYKAWQTASCNHSRILTASPVKTVVRDFIMHVPVSTRRPSIGPLGPMAPEVRRHSPPHRFDVISSS
jgi:hypothetical protein